MSNFVFTNWDPTAYPDLSPEMLLVHMAVAALRYNTVLIRDQDLTFNRSIASAFIGPHKEVYRALLEELFATGAFKVNKMRPEHFNDQELGRKAEDSPIRARALFVAKESSYGGKQFDPDSGPLPDFHALMDGILARYPSAQKYPAPNANIPGKFRAEFLTLCDSCGSGFRDHPDFGSIRPGALEEIAELVAAPDRAVEHIRRSGRAFVGSPESPRSLVYQILDTDRFRAEQSAVQLLVQSVFAAVYCESEDADGVFSDMLPEPPLPPIEDTPVSVPLLPNEINLRPMESLEMRRGIGKAIAAVRENTARNHFLVSAQDTFEQGILPSTWQFYAEEFARQYARSMTAQRPVSIIRAAEIFRTSTQTTSGVAFALKMLGADAAAGDAALVAGGFAGLAALSAMTGWLSQVWRNLNTRRLLARAVTDSLQYRYHQVELLSVKGRRTSA